MGPSKFFSNLNGNPSISWDLVRKDVGEQLFGKKYTTIPILSEAKTFDILCVYKKEMTSHNIFEKCLQKPTYKMIGWLRDFLEISRCNQRRLYSINPRDQDHEVGPVYQFSTQDTYEGYLKEVIVRIFDIYHQVSDVSKVLPGEIFLNTSCPALSGLKELYILSDVFLCHRFYLYTRLGRREIIDNQRDERFPLAFRSTKFYLKSDGSLQVKHGAKARRNPDDAHWMPCGLNNLTIKNDPLLPLLALSSETQHKYSRFPSSMEGYRYHSGNPIVHSNRLSLRSLDDTQFRLDNPDQDIIRDHDHVPVRRHS